MALNRNPAVSAMETSGLIEALREDPKFQAVMAEIYKTHRPGIPPFDPKGTTEENLALIESIKFASGMQKGFDLLFSLLVGRTL